MSTLKKLAAGALLALASAPSSAFLIELRSEEELADVVIRIFFFNESPCASYCNLVHQTEKMLRRKSFGV